MPATGTAQEASRFKKEDILNAIATVLRHFKGVIIQELWEQPDHHMHLVKSELGTIFALPWLITWFGHVLPNYSDVVRLYDFFLAGPPLMPVYLATAIVLHREKEILNAGEHFVCYHSKHN